MTECHLLVHFVCWGGDGSGVVYVELILLIFYFVYVYQSVNVSWDDRNLMNKCIEKHATAAAAGVNHLALLKDDDARKISLHGRNLSFCPAHCSF